MLEGLAVILFVLVMFILATLGCVLLVTFLFAKRAFRVRVVLAMFAGPGLLLIPAMLLAMTDSGSALEAMLGFSFIGLLACAFIGWPVAHFATKKLDRLIQFDVGTFE